MIDEKEAGFMVMVLQVFLKQLDVSECYLMGADMSQGRIEALSLMKKCRAMANPPMKKEAEKVGSLDDVKG